MFVYVALIEMHTLAGNMMKIFSFFPYSHITFSFDEDLKSCHAIQAMNEYTPLVANYVNENCSYYVRSDKKNKKIRIVKYKIPVTEEEKNKISDFIEEYKNDKENLYNMYSAATYFVIRGFRIYKSMLCGEFIGKILTNISSVKMIKPYYKMFPKDFYKCLSEYKIYEGNLDISNFSRNEEDIYFAKIKTTNYLKKGMYILRELTYRLFFKKVSPKFDYKKARLSIDDVKR